VGELFDLMISFDVKGDVAPEVIRNPVLVAIRIKNTAHAVEFVFRDRQCDRSTGAVYKVE
jgi:hypothetical protein